MVTPFSSFLNQCFPYGHYDYYDGGKEKADWLKDGEGAPDQVVHEALSNMRTVRMFGCEEYEFNRFTKMVQKSQRPKSVWECTCGSG